MPAKNKRSKSASDQWARRSDAAAAAANELPDDEARLEDVPSTADDFAVNGFGEVTAVTTYLVKRKVEGP